MTYKIMNKLFPDSFSDKYKPRPSFSSYNTRNNQNLRNPKYRIEHFKKSVHYSALKDCNNTPINIREIRNLTTFKRQLKMYLMSKF